MKIDGVPDTITQLEVCDLVRSLGLDPNLVRYVHIGLGAIRVEVVALNDKGCMFLEDGVPAVHRLVIPVVP